MEDLIVIDNDEDNRTLNDQNDLKLSYFGDPLGKYIYIILILKINITNIVYY